MEEKRIGIIFLIVFAVFLFTNFVSAVVTCTCDNDGSICGLSNDYYCGQGTCININTGLMCEPGCGDGICGSDETCSSCPTDCGTCPPPVTSCADFCNAASAGYTGVCSSDPESYTFAFPYGDAGCSDSYCSCFVYCSSDIDCPDELYCSDNSLVTEDWYCHPGHTCELLSTVTTPCGTTSCNTALDWTGSCSNYCGSGVCNTCTPTCTCISPYINYNGLPADGCECLPNCAEKECGSNGCGETCGDCEVIYGTGYTCRSDGVCIPPTAGCGDGTITSPETCDDGEENNGVICTASYGSSCTYCSASCQTITVTGLYCGDGTCSSAYGETCSTCPADCGCIGEEECIEGSCVVPNIFWSLDGDTEISTTEADPLEINLGYDVYLVIEDSGYPTGTMDFNVYEADPTTNDSIRGLTGDVDASGKAVATWTITEADLIEASSDFLDQESGIYDDFEFYFKAGASEEFESGIFYTEHIEPPEAYLFWVDENFNVIDTSQTDHIYYVGDKLRLYVIYMEPEVEAVFEIYEDDSPITQTEIRVGESALPTTTDQDGVASVEWVISSSDVQEALQKGNDPPFELYFKVNDDLVSEQLITELRDFRYDCEGITLCSQYDSFDNPQTSCENDGCNIGANNCSNYICECQWDDVGGVCNQVGYDEPSIETNVCVWCIDDVDVLGTWCDMPEGTNDYCNTTGTGCGVGDSITNSIYCDAIDFAIGSCTYLTDDSGDEEGCEDDGYLTYSWGGRWGWNDVANSFAPPDPDPDGDDFLEDPPGIWRYDPTRLSVDCDNKGGTSSALCPAQIELPFFGTWGIIVTIGLIVLIYVVLNMKKHKGKKAKKKKK